MMPFEFRINLDLELGRLLGVCEVFVPSSVIRELEGLAEGNRAARAALRLARKYEGYATERRGDPAIVAAAQSLGATVVTNDARLLKILRRQGVPRILLRSQSHLVYEP